MRQFLAFCTILTFLIIPSRLVRAFDFNPNNIISDFELKDKNSMSLNAIQAFLNKHDSVLKDRIFEVAGRQKTVAEIIYEAAQEHFISPKFILTKLDHEQCLIRGCSFLEEPAKLGRALDWACGFGVCTGCDINDPKLQKYKGFANQVDALASVQNDYIRRAAGASHIYSKGQTFTTRDGYTITPENQATANLYTYTPYRGGSTNIGGNYFFAKLWNKYWGRQLYPDGTVLKDANNNYWLIDGGVKRRYASLSVYLSSHLPPEAITVSEAVLAEYESGPEIKFANYSLVQDETGTIYLLVNDRKRLIEDQETFRQLGFNPEEVEKVNSREIADYRNAVAITKRAIYPQGRLLQEAGSGLLYWVQNGFKYLVNAEVAVLNYPGYQTQIVSSQEMETYYSGDPQQIKDGKLVKSSEGQIYLVSGGYLRPFNSQTDFIALFGETKWSQVKEVSSATLALHQVTDPLEVSVYERNQPQVAGEKVTRDEVKYQVLWIGSEVPAAFIAGKSTSVKVIFRNKSSARWEKGTVYLKLEEFSQQVTNNDLVLTNSEHTFSLPLTLEASGPVNLSFKLYTSAGEYIPGGYYQARAVVVAPAYQAVIMEHNLPVAVKNDWSRVAVAVKIKNQGRQAWTRQKTGLKFYTGSGGGSPFYDPADWLDAELASVSLEPLKDKIEPGETAVFRFRLKPQGLAPGVYHYQLVLWLKDKEETVYLNGGEFYKGVMRVDD